MSTKVWVGPGDQAVSSVFVISGAGQRTVILRALGSSLASTVAGSLADPTLDLFDSTGVLIASNDNWRQADNSPFAAGGPYESLQPADDFEAALAIDLPPGAYSAVVRGTNDTTGTAFLELYSIAKEADATLSSVSARGLLQTGDDVLLAGLALEGESGTSLILRGLGPSLSEGGIANALPDPTLELYDSNGVPIAANNDWQDDPDQLLALQSSGLAPRNALESALVTAPLPPGNYTILFRGNNGVTGTGVVEVYDVQ